MGASLPSFTTSLSLRIGTSLCHFPMVLVYLLLPLLRTALIIPSAK